MKKQLSYYVKKLEEAGIDTSVFNLEKNGVVLQVQDLIQCNEVVGDYHVSPNSDCLRKYALLFLRMYKATSTNYKKGIEEVGFNAYMRNVLSNDYQFEFIKEGLHMNGMAREFFNFMFDEMSIRLLMFDYRKRFCKQVGNNVDKMNALRECLDELSTLSGKEFNRAIESFVDDHTALTSETAKYSGWKDSYKGFMVLCTFQYLKDKKILKTDITAQDLMKECEVDRWVVFNKLEQICAESDVDLTNVSLEEIK